MKAITPNYLPPNPVMFLVCIGCLIVSLFGVAGGGKADADDVSSKTPSPSVGLTYQVYLPSGNPRVYSDQGSPTYWREGLALAQGDQIQVNADVATGSQPLVRFQAQVDRLPDVATTASPWAITIDTKTLSLGSHTLEVQAQLGGGKTRLAKRITQFTLVPSLPDTDVAASSGGVVTSVKGTEQVLSQGNVTSVPLPNDPVKVPALIAAGHLDGNALISLDFSAVNDPAVAAGKPLVLDQAMTIRISPKFASSARRFVFRLARNGDVLYTSPTILDAESTRIRLQPKANDQAGLLPGIVHLLVWGIDDAGNYGPVSDATLDVRQPGPASPSGH